MRWRVTDAGPIVRAFVKRPYSQSSQEAILQSGFQAILSSALADLQLLALFGVVMWAVFAVNTLLLNGMLDRLGVYPRQFTGLIGVPLAPFLHADVNHLGSNLGGLAMLGGLVALRGSEVFTVVTLAAMLASGLGTWLIGRPAFHIGASGVIFGYLGFLLARGYVERNAIAALATIIGFAFYASLIWGIFPSGGRVSWESHFSGFLGGVLTARYLETLRSLLPPDLV